MRNVRTLEKRTTDDAAGAGQLQVSASVDVQASESDVPQVGAGRQRRKAGAVAEKARVSEMNPLRHQARVYLAQAKATKHLAWAFTLLSWAAKCRRESVNVQRGLFVNLNQQDVL